MQSSVPSRAPSKSTGIGGDSSGGATAVQLAATRAAINVEYAKESKKSQDTVMGDLSQIYFQRGFEAAASQLKIDLSSKSDQIPIPKLNALLKLMASGVERSGGAHRSADRIDSDDRHSQQSGRHQPQHRCNME